MLALVSAPTHETYSRFVVLGTGPAFHWIEKGDEKMEMVEVGGIVKATTDLAILLNNDEHDNWIPLSQIEDVSDYEVGEDIVINIPEWLAFEKDLI